MVFFITGASSFVGVEVCRYLADNGHEIIAMSRRDNEQLNAIAKGGHLKVFRADMQNLVERATDVKADVFIHFAWAGTSQEERNNVVVQKENIRLSLEYVRLAKCMGCQLYLDAGSQAEYGIVPGVITEETECHPISPYGKAKLQLFKETSRVTKELKMKYIHLRILSIYGENDHDETLIKTSLKKLMTNIPIEMHSGGQKWNYVYVKDAARQICELAFYAISNDSFKQDIYNIASNDTRKLEEFIITMKGLLGSSSTLIFGGYNQNSDVNLDPDTEKTASIVKPLTNYKFEEVILKIVKR